MATILVGMADLNAVKNPDTLTTLGLGSCVGVTLYDPARQIGGMAHVMLPQINGQVDQNRAKFADTAIVDLLQKMVGMGASRTALVAKLAGGAHMFGSVGAQNFLKIGDRNTEACIEVLTKLSIPIRANDTGGQYGRTIELYTSNGALRIKTVGYGEKII